MFKSLMQNNRNKMEQNRLRSRDSICTLVIFSFVNDPLCVLDYYITICITSAFMYRDPYCGRRKAYCWSHS